MDRRGAQHTQICMTIHGFPGHRFPEHNARSLAASSNSCIFQWRSILETHFQGLHVEVFVSAFMELSFHLLPLCACSFLSPPIPKNLAKHCFQSSAFLSRCASMSLRHALGPKQNWEPVATSKLTHPTEVCTQVGSKAWENGR